MLIISLKVVRATDGKLAELRRREAELAGAAHKKERSASQRLCCTCLSIFTSIYRSIDLSIYHNDNNSNTNDTENACTTADTSSGKKERSAIGKQIMALQGSEEYIYK